MGTNSSQVETKVSLASQNGKRDIPAAVSTLLKVMIDPNSPASTRVRAADSILDHAAKAIEIEDIEVRVAQLEAAAKAASTA